MPKYDLNFGPDYAGQSATVTDKDGAAVAASPVTLDSNGAAQLTLPVAGEPYLAGTSNARTGLGNAFTNLTLDIPESLDQSGASGFDLEGEGSPVLNEIDPATAGVGFTYRDTNTGAFYMVIDVEDVPVWALLGGEISAAPDFFCGVNTGRGVVLLGSAGTSGIASGMTDIDGYNNSGNGVYWMNGGSGDGDQQFEIRVGPNGDRKQTTWFSDGSVDFPALVGCEGELFAAGPIGTSAAAPLDADIQPGRVYLWFDSTNGAAKLGVKGKSADGTVVTGTVALA